jgi:hypothetical protein
MTRQRCKIDLPKMKIEVNSRKLIMDAMWQKIERRYWKLL